MGWPSVEWGLKNISAKELTEWMAYAKTDPLSHQDRADWRAAMQASVLAEINRDKKKKPEPYTAADFMPDFGTASGDDDDGQTPEQMLALVVALNAAYGGRDLRPGAKG